MCDPYIVLQSNFDGSNSLGPTVCGVRKQPIIALYFESENDLKFYNLKARTDNSRRPCFYQLRPHSVCDACHISI